MPWECADSGMEDHKKCCLDSCAFFKYFLLLILSMSLFDLFHQSIGSIF